MILPTTETRSAGTASRTLRYSGRVGNGGAYWIRSAQLSLERRIADGLRRSPLDSEDDSELASRSGPDYPNRGQRVKHLITLRVLMLLFLTACRSPKHVTTTYLQHHS